MKRIAALISAGFVAALVSTQSAQAEPVNPDFGSVNVGPVTSGPVLAQGAAGFDANGISAAAAASSPPGVAPGNAGAGPSFTYVPIPDNIVVTTGGPPQTTNGIIANPGTGLQSACAPGQTGYYVYDSNGMFVGIVCVPNATTPNTTIGATALSLADEASSRQPWPRLTVDVNPETGTTGLESWFWLAPGTAAMPEASATAGPLTVIVKAALADVLWEFGDGSRIDSGLNLGQAYPSQSVVRHVYQTDSYQRSAGYQVLATVRFGVWYSVNAGPWRFLGTKAKSYSLSYVVNQIQPEGVPTTP